MDFAFPSAPTDSLYKFLAIFGFVFAMTTFFYADFMENEARKLLVEWSIEAKNKQFEFEKKIRRDGGGCVVETYQEKDVALAVLDIKSKYLLAQAKRADNYALLRNVGAPFGLMLSVFGFWMWHVRIQRLQDIILKREAEISRRPQRRD